MNPQLTATDPPAYFDTGKHASDLIACSLCLYVSASLYLHTCAYEFGKVFGYWPDEPPWSKLLRSGLEFVENQTPCDNKSLQVQVSVVFCLTCDGLCKRLGSIYLYGPLLQ